MSHSVCPWWMGYFLISPVRHWLQDPRQILDSYVREGMTVLEPGPGMGFFTLELLRMVGANGKVVAVDVQPKMLDRLKRRAATACLASRLDARVAPPESMGIADLGGTVDFTLAFAVVHEFPDAGNFFRQVALASKTGARVLLAEPAGHVTPAEFDGEVAAAEQQGFRVQSRPEVRKSQTTLFQKK